MESPCCEQRAAKVSLAEILRCFEHPISEEQAWAICFQCCCRMKELAQGLYPSLHSVFIKGPGSIFIHADGTVSFRVYHKSDAGSIQQSEDKLLEYLGVVIYEALDWGIDSHVERELSDPLDKLLCLMLKLDDEGMKPTVTLQDVIKACEHHLSVPSEATSHYKMTCKSLFTEFIELQKLVSIIQTSKESLKKMDEEDLLETHMQKKEKQWASLWPSVICELKNGVKLRKATERPQRPVPLKECTYSPYELLLDDIRHKRYKLRKVLERKLKECVPSEPTLHKQLMAEIKQPQKLQSSSARESGSRPKDASAAFQIVNAVAQHSRSGVQEMIPKLSSSTQLASARSSAVSYSSTGLAADHTLPSMSIPMLGDLQPNSVLNVGQRQLHPYRGRSKSLDTGLQSKKFDFYFPTARPSPTIAELIGTRYAMIVLKRGGFSQGGSDGVFPRGKICFSCHKQMFLKWPYSCYLCSSVICCDCCIKMSMPFRMCVHLPLHFLKLLRLSREEDPATQEQKNSELLREIEQWECNSVPVILEPHGLAQPLCCHTRTMANWLTADICTQCEHYLLNVASNQQQNIPLRRISQSWTKLE
ncbi:protein spire homolog 1-like isoform X2 [Phasianus colchicus]|uniref:protein spire homolog 1-like isoform X2 n=1 Tax=Phasianus colchicus TaxID=9054 RepID=UPI00129ED3C0|nr:protein spire homolog 1-like isoform X2 [Phasianus colchicus]